MVLNLTGADGTQPTYVTAWADGTPQPLASVLNLTTGQIAANLVTVPLGANDKIDLYNRFGDLDLIADIAGYFAPPVTSCSSGCVHSWSDTDGDGELGARGAFSGGLPVALYGLTGVTSVVGADATGYALRSDGTVWAWGDNTSGGLDDGAPSGGCQAVGDCVATAPIRTVGLTGVTAITGAWSGAYALRSDGTVWSIGHTALGAGPVQVPGLTGITAISGNTTLYALRSDGTVWAFGLDNYGQLGNGATSDSGSPIGPVQVSGLTGVTAVSGGGLTGYALRSDGTVWAWGYNAGGLGTGTAGGMSDVPVQIAGLTGVTAITGNFGSENVVDNAAGLGANGFGLALRSDGTVWGWGYDQNGQLGNAARNDWVFQPTQVSGLTGVTAIGAGNNTGYAARSDGTAWAFGWGVGGELGNGATEESDVPVQVSGLTGVTAITGGNGYGYAIVANPA